MGYNRRATGVNYKKRAVTNPPTAKSTYAYYWCELQKERTTGTVMVVRVGFFSPVPLPVQVHLSKYRNVTITAVIKSKYSQYTVATALLFELATIWGSSHVWGQLEAP